MAFKLIARTGGKRRILLISPESSYRITPFVRAATKLDVDVTLVSSGQSILAASLGTSPSAGVKTDFSDPDTAVRDIINSDICKDIDGVIGTDDQTVEVAARIALHLGLPHNPPGVAKASQRKDLSRQALRNAGLLIPRFYLVDLDDRSNGCFAPPLWPCVVKPTMLSASRGVIRVNNKSALEHAKERIKRLLEHERVKEKYILIESFIPGDEVAVEGFLRAGQLTVLSIFDKPDALDGPYFEETYYISPSRHSEKIQNEILKTLSQACRALGFTEGPIHAECRINEQGIWILEIASRTIGGECARLFQYNANKDLEKLVIENALRDPVDFESTDEGVGVLMLPVPEAGVLRRVEGLSQAKSGAFIKDIVINIREGQVLVPWPEGGPYPGFVFASAPTAAQTESALREAHDCLHFVVAPQLPLTVNQ